MAFVNYNGQQVLTGDPYMGRLQTGLDAYNQSTGGNMTLQQYDEMLNPTTYGARWGVPQNADAMSPMPSAPAYGSGTGTTDYSTSGTGNPYLSGMADEMNRRTQQGLGDAFNQIRSTSIGVGGLGGSRQGVAEGVATRGAMDSLQGNLANLFGGQYNADQNRDLQRYGIDTNFYTAQRGQDLQQTGLGADLWAKGVQGPWSTLSPAYGIFGGAAGLNTTGTNTGQQGGGAMGLLGGAYGGLQLANALGKAGSTGGSSWDWTGMPAGVF